MNTNAVPEEKISYGTIFRQKEYLKIISANLISRFGDSIDAIAFTWLVYAVTKSAAWSAIIFAINQLPSVLVQPFAGVLVEGMDKKKLIVITDFVRGAITVCLAVFYFTENITPWVLILFTVINSSAEAFCLPASTAVIPKILDKRYYTYGTSLNSTLSTIVQLVGLGAAGVIIGTFGIGAAIFIDGFSFFGSALILCFLNLKETNLRKEKLNMKEYSNTLKGGMAYLKAKPVIRNFCLSAVFINALIVPFNALQSPLVTEVLGQGSELLGILSIAMMTGMGIASFCYPLLNKKFKIRTLFVFAGFAIALGLYLYTLGAIFQDNRLFIYILTVTASFLLGSGASICSATLSIQFMKVVEQDYLARVSSIFNACACAASPIMSILVSGLTTVCSVSQIFLLSALLCAIIFLVIAITKMRLE